MKRDRRVKNPQKDREFTDDDFEHYSQIVTILQRTIELMKNIDKIPNG